MSSASTDQARLDARDGARHLVRFPLVLAERDPEMHAKIRRHGDLLDRWFTQRFGYRLEVEADTIRLRKTSVVPSNRPLMTATSTPRPFSQREYVLLALILSAVVAGPNVISLRDLILEVRSAATDAEVPFGASATDRRAVVTALRWAIEHGVVAELHDRVDRYAIDDEADAILKIRPDRIAMLALPNLAGALTPDQLIDRSERRQQTRQWLRSWLLEEPVLYRDDVTEAEWSELRRRLGEEANWFDEMFGLELEARAEGIAAVDPDGRLTDRRFPATGTVGHAALLLIDDLAGTDRSEFDHRQLIDAVTALSATYGSYWSALSDQPEQLLDQVIDLLVDHRLAQRLEAPGGDPADSPSVPVARLLPAAWRFRAETTVSEHGEQQSLL